MLSAGNLRGFDVGGWPKGRQEATKKRIEKSKRLGESGDGGIKSETNQP